MRTLILALISLIAQPVFATFPNFVAVELRTTGVDTNGGGFQPGTDPNNACTGGTDYSQQNSAQLAINNSTVTATTSGTSAVLTIAGYTPATTDKCNIVQIVSGTNMTTGFFIILTVSGQTWTLDRNVSSGAGSAVVANMGGALLTLQKAFALTDTNSANSDTVWMKSGTFTTTAATTFPTQSHNITVRGYQTTHGDNTGTKPLFTTATNSTKLLTANATNKGATFNNINFSNTAGTRDDCFYASTGGAAGSLAIINSSLDGCAIGINGRYSTVYYFNSVYLYQVEIKNCTGNGYEGIGSAHIDGLHSHHNGGDGVQFGGGGNGSVNVMLTMINSVLDHNTGAGFHYSYGTPNASASISNNNFYLNTLSGVKLANSDQYFNLSMVNNIMDSNVRYGIEDAGTLGANGVFFRYNNAFRNNTLGATLKVPVETSDITLSVIPWVDAPSNNFALNATSGGGALLRALGFPGTIPTAGTGYLDIGALQSQGGGGPVSHAQQQ